MFESLTDQCGRKVELQEKPRRIISLVPSLTELLYELGLENRLVGITRFCVHPEKALEDKTVVGGTKKVVNKRIRDLQPDLIICNKEENTQDIVAYCAGIAPTYVSNIGTLEECLEMIRQLGVLTGTAALAQELSLQIKSDFLNLQQPNSPLKAIYLIWKNPYMSIGSDTFIHEMMEKAGFENLLSPQTRYPQLDLQEIIDLEPEIMLLSSEPYNFNVIDVDEICSAFAKAGKKQPQCMLVDGELFSWYGSRILKAPAYFSKLRETISGRSH